MTQARIVIQEADKADSYPLITWYGAISATAPAAVVMFVLAHAVRRIADEHDADLAAEYAAAMGECVAELIDGICGECGASEVVTPASISIDLEELEATLTLSVRPSLAVSQ